MVKVDRNRGIEAEYCRTRIASAIRYTRHAEKSHACEFEFRFRVPNWSSELELLSEPQFVTNEMFPD